MARRFDSLQTTHKTRKLKSFAFLAVFVLVPFIASSEPQIHHFYPDRPVLLGQPIFWAVEIRHAMWESYDLKFGSCPDLQISVADKMLSEVAGEIRILYRIAIIPTALKPACTPVVTIFDPKGQTTVLNGKPVRVHTISGASEEIKQPPPPFLARRSVNRSVFLYFLLFAIVILSCLFIGKRIYNNTPAQKFLRDLRKAAAEVAKDRLPIQIWRLLRSQMVWGFVAEAYTPSQLEQKASDDPRLVVIASTLRSLESWRYSGSGAQWDRTLVKQALGQAEELILSKSPLRRRRRAA